MLIGVVCLLLGIVAAVSRAVADAPAAEGATVDSASVDSSADIEFFEQRVRPVLVEHCGSCHGAEKQFGGLRVDSWASLSSDSDSAPVIIAGSPDQSLLVRAVRRQGGLEMPPDQPLAAGEVDAIVEWVRRGASWPDQEPTPPDTIAELAADHWAFQPLRRPEIPAAEQSSWPRGAIDRFVLAKLEAQRLTPSPPADRRDLAIRASYVATGLPPTPSQVERFVNSTDPLAYEKLVDELLASPHYGEHLARHWLDIARYSDSKGYVYAREERFWTHAWSYRDWVTESFNNDRPYDDFLLLQLAADQAASSPADLAAMGFLTLGRRFLGVKPDIIDDRIDVVTRGMLGLTVSCARCHDHKFDPIPTADYYSLYGVFDSCLERERSISQRAELAPEYLAELDRRQAAYDQRMAEVRREVADRVRDRLDDYLAAQFELEKYPDETFGQLFQKTDLLPSFVHRWQDYLRDAAQTEDPVFVAWHRLVALADLPRSQFADQARKICGELLREPPEKVNPLVAEAFRQPPETLAEVPARYAELFATIRDQANAELAANADDPQVRLADPAAESLRRVLVGRESPCVIPEGSIVEVESMMDVDSTQQLWKLQGEIDRWVIRSETADRRARILVDRETPIEPRIFSRGNPLRKAERVSRHFPSLFDSGPPQPFAIGSGRLELARRIIADDNPLTARVIVNRIWGQAFGRPLVDSPSDFGLRAAPPSHPELLDWLASRLIADGWSLKRLHRQILLSSTFRQSDQGPESIEIAARAVQIDPLNRSLWRWQPRRLTLEELRDSLACAADRFDRTVGGKPVDRLWTAPFSDRRALYGLVDRQFLPGLLRTFDFANPDLHIAQRSETTVPQQALFFMNHPLMLSRARDLAEQDLAEHKLAERAEDETAAVAASSSDRVTELFRRILRRQPTAEELADALAFISAAADQPPPPARDTAADWAYGYGEFDRSAGRTARFTELPHYSGQAWQGGSAYPDATLGWVRLDATGGHPGNDLAHAAVRRWTARKDMTVRIVSTITHEPPQGDGVRAFIVSGPAVGDGVNRTADTTAATPSSGLLAEVIVHQRSAEMNVDAFRVSAGQTIDFIVDIGDTLSHDQFLWPVRLIGRPLDADAGDLAADSGGETVWDSAKDFAGDATVSLDPWGQLAQVLLSANEFFFIP